MSKRNGTMDLIKDRIAELNRRRAEIGLRPVERCWTGCASWLKEPTGSKSSDYRSMGGNFCDDAALLGFLEGLLHQQEQGDASARRTAVIKALTDLRIEGELTEDFAIEVHDLLASP